MVILRSVVKRFWHQALFVQLIILSIGCATYEPKDNAKLLTSADISQNETVVSVDSLEIHLVALTDKNLAKNYVGIDPSKCNMVPVFMKVNNNGDDAVKIDLSQSFLKTKSGDMCKLLPIEESVKRAMRSDAEVVGWTVAFGAIGGIVGGSKTASANKSLEEDYHQKHFKPTLINAKNSAEGIIFFEVPEEKQSTIITALIQISNLTTNCSKTIVMNLPAKAVE